MWPGCAGIPGFVMFWMERKDPHPKTPIRDVPMRASPALCARLLVGTDDRGMDQAVAAGFN